MINSSQHDELCRHLRQAGFFPIPVPVPGGVDLGLIRLADGIASIVVLTRYGLCRVLEVPTRHVLSPPFEHADPTLDLELSRPEALHYFLRSSGETDEFGHTRNA
jgi:hypothetical protein